MAFRLLTMVAVLGLSGVGWANDAGADAAIDVVLSGREPFAVELRFDLERPTVVLVRDGRRYPALEVKLAAVDVNRTSGGPTKLLRGTYRLEFTVDGCLHSRAVVPDGTWPGPCGYFKGDKPHVRPDRFELLLDRHSTVFESVEHHLFQASCVPVSGAGPSCSLHAEVRKGPKAK